MIDIAELEQYFPETNKRIIEGIYMFKISLQQEDKEEIFIVNLKIKQQDTKNEHLIKFRIGLGKDKESKSETHDTHKPHFEIDLYKREEDSFSASMYFTFNETNDELLMKYAKGTVVLITRIIDLFCTNHQLNKDVLKRIVHEDAVLEELSSFESILITALHDCYKKSQIVVNYDGTVIPIKTIHNLEKYLNQEDLKPLYLPLKEMVENEKI